MKANPAYLLEALSNNDVTFFIPPYQRNYEWKQETCRVFFNDVLKVASDNSAGSKTEHFFGSIVYVVEESGFGQPSRYILTDGQQRITTTMLFLMALRDSVQDETYASTIQLRYIENQRVSDESDFKIKLKQVETDWEAYKHLALKRHKDVLGALKNSAVYQNYNFFKREIDKLSVEKKKSLLERGLLKFSIIAIELESEKNPWENPQEIFESMNSLGQPLALADLVRNYLLMGRSSQQQTALYLDYWLKLERSLPGKLSEFIRDWMQSDQHRSFKVAKDSNHKELYGQFKEIVNGRSCEQLFAEFVRYMTPYLVVNALVEDTNKKITELFLDLHVIGITPAYSFLTELLLLRDDGEIDNAAVVEVLTCVRTYLLRRRIIQSTTAENKLFPTLGQHLYRIVDSQNVSLDFFRLLSSYEFALRLPNDSEVGAKLEVMNFYNFGTRSSYPRLLLCLVEEVLTKARPRIDDDKLQLEHIMPQTLTSDWRVMLGSNYDSVHLNLLHNIGNIALIRHNQELGNKSFDEKKELYSDKAGLQVTQNFVLDCDAWDEASILARRKYLINLLLFGAIEIPEVLRNQNNWGGVGSDLVQFDSKRILTHLIGSKICYIPNPLLEAEVLSDSEVSFEGEVWRLSPLTTELKRRAGGVSVTSNFYGPSNWSHDGVRLTDFDI